ncbi:hypothetical protein ACFL6U_30100 [Planctomycetota bacterium]
MNTEADSSVQPSFWRRRWMVFLVGDCLTILAVVLIFQAVNPKYQVTGTLRVAARNHIAGPNQPRDFEAYLQTQIAALTSSVVLERVAEELTHQDMVRIDANSVTQGTDHLSQLRRQVKRGILTATAIPDTELIKVTMTDPAVDRATFVVNALMRNFLAVQHDGASPGDHDKLRRLEKERDEIEDTLNRMRQEIRDLTQSQGSQNDLVDQRQQVFLLTAELRQVEQERVHNQQRRDQLEQTAPTPSPELLVQRQQYILADPRVATLAQRFTDLETALHMAKAADSNEADATLGVLRGLLEDRQEQIGQVFDQKTAAMQTEKHQQDRAHLEDQAKRLTEQEELLRTQLAQAEKTVQVLNQTQLRIQDIQFQLGMDKEVFDALSRHINTLTIACQRLPRITLHSHAETETFIDKRWSWGFVVALIGIAVTLVTALARDVRRNQPPENA